MVADVVVGVVVGVVVNVVRGSPGPYVTPSSSSTGGGPGAKGLVGAFETDLGMGRRESFDGTADLKGTLESVVNVPDAPYMPGSI